MICDDRGLSVSGKFILGIFAAMLLISLMFFTSGFLTAMKVPASTQEYKDKRLNAEPGSPSARPARMPGKNAAVSGSAYAPLSMSIQKENMIGEYYPRHLPSARSAAIVHKRDMPYKFAGNQ